MSKKKKQNPKSDYPPDWPYPGCERFGDWDFGENSNVIWLDEGQQLVNDDPEGDPHKIANLPPPRGRGKGGS